jgi:hypothetical protein
LAKDELTARQSHERILLLKWIHFHIRIRSKEAHRDDNRKFKPAIPSVPILDISCTRLPGALAAKSISDAKAEDVMCITAGGACALQRQAPADFQQTIVEIH